MAHECQISENIFWRSETSLIGFSDALDAMNLRNGAINDGSADELIWLLEHPPVYTAGTSAKQDDLLDPRFDVVSAGRGGRHTYHGPGQRVCYVLVDLKKRARDARGFVSALESWMIATLEDFGVKSWRSDAGVGIWTHDPQGQEAKIGAIGVRIRRWVTMHGFAVNLSPDLSHFGGIVPCGIADKGVTSLAALGIAVDNAAWDRALMARAEDFLALLQQPCKNEGA